MDLIVRDGQEPMVMGRQFHTALEVATHYRDWFPRMCEYGFIECRDFRSILSESSGGRPATDHQLTIDMAKQICMLQRSEKGREFREYFIEVEKQWNSLEAVIARALQIANNRVTELQNRVAQQAQQLSIAAPKATYYDEVLRCTNPMRITDIAKDYGWSGRRLNQFLHERGIQYKLGDIWLLYQQYAGEGYTVSQTFPVEDSSGNMYAHVHTYWTQKGRWFIYQILQSEGIHPLMECN